jgi:hypothetical protein
MTDERIAELRRLCEKGDGLSPASGCEALDEIERLRALRCNCDEDAPGHAGDCITQLPAIVEAQGAEIERLRLSDADRAALDFAAAELRERRNNVAASYSHIALTQQDNTVTDQYSQHIARLAEAIGVVDRLRGGK